VRGFTVVELMVGMTIGIVLMLLVVDVYSGSVWRQRDLSGSSDAQKTASITMFQLSNALKRAGNVIGPWSGPVGQRPLGCFLQAKKGATTLLPLPAALPAPFDGVPTNVQLVPVFILEGKPWAERTAGEKPASDILITMASNSGVGGMPFKLLADATNNALSFNNSNGLLSGDLLLAAQKDPPLGPGGGGGGGDNSGTCPIVQVGAHTVSVEEGKLADAPGTVVIGGDYAQLTALDLFDKDEQVYSLGKAPSFNVWGVDPATDSLKVVDLLQLGGATAPVSFAENVFLLKALYGVGTGPDGTVASWVLPSDSAWGSDEQLAHPRTAMAAVRAIRVALVTRGSYPATNKELSPETITLFSTSGADQTLTLTLSDDERRYRYQVYETTIPLPSMKVWEDK
jgi:type IV pilus assembly protein PilW